MASLLGYFREPGRFKRLLKVAASEPPRVRAMLGAIGEQIRQPETVLNKLQESLNPLSRFDFGILAALTYARRWQAKDAGTMRLFEHPDFDQAVIRAAEHFRPRGLRATIAAFETQCRVLCFGPSPTWEEVQSPPRRRRTWN